MADLLLPIYAMDLIDVTFAFNKVITAEVENSCSTEGKFFLNVSHAFGHSSYLPRSGEWITPWPCAVAPGYEMPVYNPTFTKSFSEVTDQRAIELKQLINAGKEVVVFYSGGIDSTVPVVALLKNLSQEELSKVHLAISQDSIIENPNFYRDYIQGKFNLINSQENRYSDLINQGYVCVPADLGDSMFGTILGLKMFTQYGKLSSDAHYSTHKDVIIQYLNSVLAKKKKVLHPGDEKFGEMYYEKLVQNISTSSVPIYTLHDFFWWVIFNIKYMHCALRPAILYSAGDNCRAFFEQGIFNWYNTVDYQQWSMVNNNNGQKIQGTNQRSYKYAAKKYIFDFDKNSWYFRYKLKMPSMPTLRLRNYKKNFKDFDNRIGMNSNYDIIKFGDPGVNDYIIDKLTNFNR
jgi:hypothetical protein